MDGINIIWNNIKSVFDLQSFKPWDFSKKPLFFNQAKEWYSQKMGERNITSYPPFAFTKYSVGGIFLDKLITSPLIALGFRVQTEGIDLKKAIQDVAVSKNPFKTIYAGTSTLMMRELVYLPFFFPMIDLTRRTLFPKMLESPSNRLLQASTESIYYGGLTTILNCAWQYFKPLPLPVISVKKVVTDSYYEDGIWKCYRGFKTPPGRMLLINCLYSGVIAGMQQMIKSLRAQEK